MDETKPTDVEQPTAALEQQQTEAPPAPTPDGLPSVKETSESLKETSEAPAPEQPADPQPVDPALDPRRFTEHTEH